MVHWYSGAGTRPRPPVATDVAVSDDIDRSSKEIGLDALARDANHRQRSDRRGRWNSNSGNVDVDRPTGVDGHPFAEDLFVEPEIGGRSNGLPL